MAASFLIGLREGLEAALILGVTFGVLRRLRRPELAPPAYAGIVAAVMVSLAAAAILFSVGAELEGKPEAVFEALTMLLAAGILTWMILWMGVQGRQVQIGLERDVEQAALRRQAGAVFAVAFLAVVREGIETALFLSAAAFQDSQAAVAVGGVLGLAAAAVLGWLVYRATIRLNVKAFFRVTGLLLVLFAAGLFAHGVHELVEVGLLPALVDPLWTTEAYLSESSAIGILLKTLFGYSAEPTLFEVLAYLGYFAAVALSLRWMRERNAAALAAAG